MLYTLWRVNDIERSAVEMDSGSREDMLRASSQIAVGEVGLTEGIRYEVLPAGGAPFDAVSEPAPCGCYSCNGGCGGTQAPGFCGPLADVAGQQICEVCRDAADVFANDDSGREGLKAITDGYQVTIKTHVFGGARSMNFSPAQARLFAARLTELADQSEGGE